MTMKKVSSSKLWMFYFVVIKLDNHRMVPFNVNIGKKLWLLLEFDFRAIRYSFNQLKIFELVAALNLAFGGIHENLLRMAGITIAILCSRQVDEFLPIFLNGLQQIKSFFDNLGFSKTSARNLQQFKTTQSFGRPENTKFNGFVSCAVSL